MLNDTTGNAISKIQFCGKLCSDFFSKFQEKGNGEGTYMLKEIQGSLVTVYLLCKVDKLFPIPSTKYN